MKLATYSYKDSVSCGILTDNGFIDIPCHTAKKCRCCRSIEEIFMTGPACLDEVRKLAESPKDIIPANSVRLLSPIPRPGKVLALAGNYVKHIIEHGKKLGLAEQPDKTTVPRPFLMPSTAVTGPDTTIPWPDYSRQVDYEIELAVFIGKPAKCISPDQAVEYIGGYTIANDISARSVTFSEGRAKRPWDEFFDWLNGKWSDGFMPLGPYLVTPDEIPDPQNLHLELAVNDRIRQNACTSQMIFTVAQIVSFISHLVTLEPGDCIATGTPEGVGMATGQFLKPGDKIRCTIEGIGTLSNTMGRQPSEFYQPCSASGR